MGETLTRAELEAMLLDGRFDEMTDDDCDRATIDIQLDWQAYCKACEPDCTLSYFQWGHEE